MMIACTAGISMAQMMDTPTGATSYFEDFEDAVMPALPLGWNAIINSSNANADILTSSLQDPFSGTQAVRFTNSFDANAILILSTPLSANFESNWFTFYAKMGSLNHSTNLIMGYMSDPNDAQTFTATDTVYVAGANYQQFRMQFKGIPDATSCHIAFRYAPGLNNHFLYVDDVRWEQAPANPIPVIAAQGEFGVVDLDSEKTMEFTLENHGVNTLVIAENDFSFIGADASVFSLKSVFQYPLEVAFNQSISIELSFLPVTAGEKTAQMQLNHNTTGSAMLFDLSGTGLPVLDEYTEDFSGSSPPALAGGWSGIIQSATAAILPVTNMNPVSPPYHIRITTGSAYDGVIYLVGPKVRNFETNWLRFYTRMSSSAHTENVVVGVMTNRDDASTFTPVSTVQVQGLVNQQHNVYMTPLVDADEFHIAFKFASNDNNRTFYFDEVFYGAIPTEAVFLLSPSTYEFPARQINTISAAQEFVITNDGPVEFSISAADLHFTGPDASVFSIVDAPQLPQTLAFGESAEFSVAFAPTTPGLKQASLNVRDRQFEISGLSIDATITQLPHFEDFNDVSTPNLPLGWGRIVHNPGLTQAHVNTVTTGTPYSAPIHVSINSNHNAVQDVILVTPPVSNLQQKRIRFQAKASAGTNIPDLIVGTMTNAEDASTFTPFRTLVAIEEFNNVYSQYVISFDETIGGDSYIGFRHGGSQSLTRAIFIDDVLIEEAPTGPVLVTDADSIDFGVSQIAYSSFPITITLGNEGAGLLVLNNEDMVISGADAESFAVLPFSEPLEIPEFETVTIAVEFHPLLQGIKNAVLTINGITVMLAGEGIDATITELPHLENFDGVTAPAFPAGWVGFADNPTLATAVVEVIITSVPQSAPNHIRLFSNQEPATIVLVSPPVNGLDNARIRFAAKTNIASNAPDLIISTTSNPADTASYNIIAVIEGVSLTTAYQEFTVPMIMAGDDTRIVFQHGATPNFTRNIFIDDIIIEEMPDDPLLVVSPMEHIFVMQQTGTSSEAAEFAILNDAGGSLAINASQIYLTGDDAADFILENLTEEVNLAAGETASVNVRFAPYTTGIKLATLMIDTVAVSLSAEAFDATIADFPYLETFTGTAAGSLPLGWTTDRANWTVFNSSNAGGDAPEIRFHYAPTFNGASYLKTPEINTTGYEEMLFVFRHNLNNFSAPGLYTVSVVTIVGDEQHLLYQWVDPGNIAAQELEIILTEEHGIGSDKLQIAWIFEGNSNDINQYYIDNVFLDEAPPVYDVTFNVSCTEGNAIDNAVITLGDITNDAGDYFFELFEGTYDYTITAPHFEPVAVQDLLVDQDAIINITLTPLAYTITFAVTDAGLNPITDAVVTLGDVTNPEGDYVFEDLAAGLYNYTVTAPHFLPLSLTGYQVDGDAIINATLSPIGYTLTFTVKDQDGAAINNAVISLGDVVNPEGDYVFSDLAFGTYDYQVTASHFETAVAENIIVSEDTAIDVNLNQMLYDVTFLPKDATGDIITDAVVSFGDVTNDAGDYLFQGLAHGSYSYSITAPHFETIAQADYMLLQTTEIELTMTASLYDITFVVKNSQGIDISNAVISFDGVTNPEGDYTFTGIEHGEYGYTLAAEYYIDYTSNLLVVADAQHEVVMTDVSHIVTFSVNDNQGDPIADAVITLGEVTNSAGDYVFPAVLPGLYVYSVQADAYNTFFSDDIVISDDISIDVVLTLASHTVTFTVEDEQGAAIDNAVITFGGSEAAEGVYVFTDVMPGLYDYSVAADGFNTVDYSNLEVTADITIVVVMSSIIPTFELTLNVDMSDAEGFDAGIHQVFVTGSFGDDMEWNTPGENPELTLQRVDNSMIFSITLQLPAADYAYKYASNAFGTGWDSCEWAGDPNRGITMQGDMLVDDTWGVHPDDVSVPITEAVSIRVYPNPASGNVNIVSDSFIKQLIVVDILGQVVISEVVSANNIQLNVNHLKPGVYFIQLNTDKGILKERMLVAR